MSRVGNQEAIALRIRLGVCSFRQISVIGLTGIRFQQEELTRDVVAPFVVFNRCLWETYLSKEINR